MKATLSVVENDADLTQVKAPIEKPMGSNDPANLARMTGQRADLVPLLGTPSRVSEVLTGKPALNMSMVLKLRERFQTRRTC